MPTSARDSTVRAGFSRSVAIGSVLGHQPVLDPVGAHRRRPHDLSAASNERRDSPIAVRCDSTYRHGADGRSRRKQGVGKPISDSPPLPAVLDDKCNLPPARTGHQASPTDDSAAHIRHQIDATTRIAAAYRGDELVGCAGAETEHALEQCVGRTPAEHVCDRGCRFRADCAHRNGCDICGLAGTRQPPQVQRSHPSPLLTWAVRASWAWMTPTMSSTPAA